MKFLKGNSTDLVKIVNDLIRVIDSEVGKEASDKDYAVFDTDFNKEIQNQIDEAKELAGKNRVEILILTPTFEFWYILHFVFTTPNYNLSEEVLEEISNKIKGYAKNVNTYSIIWYKNRKSYK